MATTPTRLHPLQAQNLNQLIFLRNAILLDPVLACYEHGIDKKSAECYRAASDEELMHFAYSVDMSLFVPRFLGEELCKILKVPDEIRGIFAAVNLQNSRHEQSANDRGRGNADGRISIDLPRRGS